MNIPDKLYIEVRGEILEYDFIETIYNEKEDELEITYSNNKTFYITYYSEYTEVSDEYLYKLFDFEDLWISKEDLIKSKTQSYSKTIEHHKILFEKATEYLNKLTRL